MNKFNGLDLEKEEREQSEEDWLLGKADFGKQVLVPDGDWTPYWPSNEKQKNGFESLCCTNFSSTSDIEIMMTRMLIKNEISKSNVEWLKENGYFDKNDRINFSDRFDAIISGTNPNSGNSLKSPAEAKRKMGLIPESMLPWIDNKNKYFDKNSVTQEMYKLGQEFLRRFQINYEKVYRENFAEGLKYSPLAGALFAWNGRDERGVYYRVNEGINHAIVIIRPPHLWKIGDSYDPFHKLLDDDYIFLNYAYRYIITEHQVDEHKPNNNKKMKTIKFKTDPRIFAVSNNNSKNIMWIGGKDGWDTYKQFLGNGWMDEYEEIDDALFASYNVMGGFMSVDYDASAEKTNIISKVLNILFNN